jgi:phage-related protein
VEEQILFTRFYRSPAGAEPVREFLRSLPRDARLKCGRYMQQLEWQGLGLRTSHLKKLTREIWELRPEYEGIEYRLYFGVNGSEVVYVHAIVKKQQKAARGDIELAQRRFDEWKVAQREQQERSR